ncbi:MAG TPA: hypothetical protein VGJ57_10785 [Nitrospirales bacterium]
MRTIPATIIGLLLSCLATGAITLYAGNTSPVGSEDGSFPSEAAPVFDPLLLNIRMSPNAVRPPAGIVKQAWVLDGYRLGRLTGNAPRAAVIDDDQHRRLLILSATDDGHVQLYRVADLPIEVGAKLPALLQNAKNRNCRYQRMDPAGELGCLALSLLEALQE